jgi:hypothetical protein
MYRLNEILAGARYWQRPVAVNESLSLGSASVRHSICAAHVACLRLVSPGTTSSKKKSDCLLEKSSLLNAVSYCFLVKSVQNYWQMDNGSAKSVQPRTVAVEHLLGDLDFNSNNGVLTIDWVRQLAQSPGVRPVLTTDALICETTDLSPDHMVRIPPIFIKGVSCQYEFTFKGILKSR